MFSGLLQDWTTCDGSGTAAFTQARADWLDLSAFGDVTFWVEVRSVANPGAGSVTLTYETSPCVDDSLFQPLATVTLVASTVPVVSKIALSSNPTIPLARFVRWTLAGTAAGNWTVSLRIFAMANKGLSGGSFDPTTLVLSAYWRADYAGVPWAATATAGASATTGALVTNLNDPTAGPTQNGKTPAAFASASIQNLVNATSPSTLWTASAGTIFALAYFVTEAAANVNVYQDAPLLCDSSGGNMGLAINATGANAFVVASAAYVNVLSTAVSTGAYHLLMMRWNGSNLGITVDSLAEVTTPCGAITFAASGIGTGQSYASTTYLNGRILELGAAAYAFSNADYANLKSYMNARYGLAL